jgi:hypothetical protein
MNRRVFGVLGLWVVTLAPTAAFSQSLADTAKAEQARRKKAAPAGTPKVYTESDLPASPVKTESEPDTAKAEANASPPKKAPGGISSDERKRRETADYKAREAAMKAQIAEVEEEVQRLARHPTGGGKVCKLPEGVFKPGVTAPEQVVCPYQMESRYDEAKRHLDEMKARLTAFQDEARRHGISL